MHNKYYLSINTTSLAHYISKAIILPSRFYNNRPDDIQNLFEDYLFLSNFPFINDSDCSIELVLTEEEITNLKKIDNNIFLFDKPLPISRIKQIYFFTDDQKILTIAMINDGAGFVNENIIKILNKTDETVLKIAIPKIESFSYSDELESRIKDFDQKLGGLAFVRFNTENKYNPNYFSTLSFFNSYIKEEYEKNSIQKNIISYEGFFNISGKWKDLASLIYETIEEKDVMISANKENVSISKNEVTGMLEFEKIDSKTNTYKLAILNTYGSSSTKRKSIDDLISSFLNNPRANKIQEPISLIFGINNGYSVFYNNYKNKTVKFKMNSILDYYTIESIFQYVINHNNNCYKFKYLDNIISKKPLIDNLYFKTFNMLDETVVTENKTVISDIEDNVESGMFAPSLFDRIKSFIEKILKKKHEVEILLHQKQKENEELEAKIVGMTQNINVLTIKSQNIESKFQEEQTKLEEQQVKNSELLQQATETQSQIEELNKQLQEMQLQLKEKQEKNIELDNKVTNLNQNIKDKEFKFQEEQKKSQEQEVEYRELFKENINLKNQIARLNDKIKDKGVQLEQTQNEATNLNRKITNLEKNINEIKTTNQYNESQLQEQQVKQGNLLEQISSLEDKAEVLNKEITEIKGELQQTQEEKSLLEERLEKAKDVFRKQKLKIDSFEGKIDENSHQNKINLNGMLKPALLELARQKGIEVNNKDTVQQLKDKINLNQSSLFGKILLMNYIITQ
ncbi:MAG: hypothetical protein QM490_03250 [Candidatus Gracilibacteria bacterium]